MTKIKKDKSAIKKKITEKTKKTVSKAKAHGEKGRVAKKASHPSALNKRITVPAQPKLKKPSPVKGKVEPKKIIPEKPVISREPPVIKEVPVQERLKPVRPKIAKIKPQEKIREATKEAPPVSHKISFKKEELPKAKPEIKEEIRKAEAPLPELKDLELNIPVSVKDLSIRLQEKPSVVIKALMDMKIMVSINHLLDEDMAAAVCKKFGFKIRKAPGEEELALRIHEEPDKPGALIARAPIVTLMGHVDHGKTSLLDAIRKSKVTELEHGGITQHIGAYRVVLPAGEITFLDTPGHEAFTAMRARGASITDIVVLVVAADDGVMPQTQEAIDHARAAGVSIIVAINKIDKPQANTERVKKQLSELNLAAEDWGGKTITVPVSAKTGEGIDELLEMILLEAQMLELKANPEKLAKGVVIEAKISKGRGPVSTLLVQNGTLKSNDTIIVDKYYGKVRAMFGDHAQSVTQVLPSFAVEVLGINGVPAAGEQFFVIQDEKAARDLAASRQEQEKQKQLKAAKRISLEDLHAQIKEGKLKELKLIIKADVQGSLGAIRDVLGKLNAPEIKMEIIHEGVGTINSSDAILAVASNALILGFNVGIDQGAKDLAAKEGIDIRAYNIIYELGNDIKAALEGMLEPKLKKIFLGRAEVRKVFRLSRSGTVAGCFVSKGKIHRASTVALIRNGEAIYEGKLSSLKRFKDDVREVTEGFECGMAISGFENLQEGDIIESYDFEKIARKL